MWAILVLILADVGGESLLPDFPRWMIGVAACTIAVLVGRVLLVRFVSKESDRIVTRLLEDGICPACGYNFVGLDRDDDLLTCPECGAGWKSSRIVRAAEFASRGAGSSPLSSMVSESGSTPVPARDDQGRDIALVGRAMKRLGARASDAEHERRMAAAQAELALAGRGRRLANVAVIAFSGLLATVLLAPREPIEAGVIVLVMVLGAAYAWRGNFSLPASKAKTAFLDHGLCPSCATSLKELAPAADGCTECPECNAAWRVAKDETAP